MGDWPELLQSAIIGLIFSFLVAKLISIGISFKEDNLRLVRDPGPDPDPDSDPDPTDVDSTVPAEPEPPAASAGGESDVDDDWEGVESTELDEVFSAATVFVAATAADKAAAKVGSDVQLQLYGLYKIATEGPCTAPQPSAIKVTARAKWNAWQKLGAMSPEEAMEKYVIIVSELYPSWANGSAVKNNDEGTSGGDSASNGPMGPVFSSFVYEEDPANDPKLDALHVCAREGEADQLLKYIDDAVSVNLRDSEGRTPLHWAVDRGHINAVEALLSRKADVNAKVARILRSLLPHVFLLAGGVVSWRSSRQDTTTDSTMLAEMIGLYEAAKHAKWMKIILEDSDAMTMKVRPLCIMLFFVREKQLASCLSNTMLILI